MSLKNIRLIFPVISGVIILLAFTYSEPQRNLASYTDPFTRCYDRQKEPYTAVVDTHMHFRGFNGKSLPFSELTNYFRKSNVLFANVNGIGQILPAESTCTYYLDCPGTQVRTSTQNDFINADNYLKHKNEHAHLTLSMTFTDLTAPEGIVETMKVYDEKYPNMFKWMGEVNVMKQALLPNEHKPVRYENISKWAAFMAILQEKNIPLTIHADLGNEQDFTEFLPLIQRILSTYPQNKIILAHMGLSKELLHMPAAEHIQVIKSLLDKHPHLMVDISWNFIYETYFSKPESRALYVTFFNEYFDRILPGTDFVASADKNFAVYRKELEETSHINQYLDDNAFRHIALGENYFRLLELPYYAPQVCAN